MTAAMVDLAEAEPRRKRWTREECAHLESLGAWEGQKLELIEGELLDKMGKNRPHIVALAAVVRWLFRVFGEDFVLQEIPLAVSGADTAHNAPEPDAVVLDHPYQELGEQSEPGRVRLVVEVADSSLRLDLGVKAGLYARAGIVEYWVVDLNGRRLIVHREPVDGVYGSVVAYAESEAVSPLAASQVTVAVADLLSRRCGV